MYLFVVSLHIVLCLFLILIILLQPAKAGDVGAAFGGGGGSGNLFGPQGPTNWLQRMTTGVAVLFMVTSITLALYSNQGRMNDSNVSELLEQMMAEEASGKGFNLPEDTKEDGSIEK